MTIDELSIEDINARIKIEVCHETLKELTDEKLISKYTESNSVKNKIKKLENILDKYINKEIKQQIIKEYLLELIPPGTKSVIKGNYFNNIIKNTITKLKLNTEIFEIGFEKNCKSHFTNERPDWYILKKKTNKIIIGMNQLDLWGGGIKLIEDLNI